MPDRVIPKANTTIKSGFKVDMQIMFTHKSGGEVHEQNSLNDHRFAKRRCQRSLVLRQKYRQIANLIAAVSLFI